MTTKFASSVTRGFSAIGEPNVAVCVLPGTELAFDKEAEYDHPLARFMPRFGFGRLGAEVARFRQVNLHWPNTHHDALEFENGKVVLLTRLCLGQRATVLQLPVHARLICERRWSSPQPPDGLDLKADDSCGSKKF